MNDGWVERVLQFWFEELEPGDWFEKDDTVDAQIRSRFEDLYLRLAAQSAIAETNSPEGALATVIVFDQFPRNLFRNSPQAFATDPRALAIAQQALARGFDQQIDASRRMFFYMPFEHSEQSGMQQQSVVLFEALPDKSQLRYALEHQEVIRRFGRFPHRNAALDRASTAEEVEYLRTHRGF